MNQFLEVSILKVHRKRFHIPCELDKLKIILWTILYYFIMHACY